MTDLIIVLVGLDRAYIKEHYPSLAGYLTDSFDTGFKHNYYGLRTDVDEPQILQYTHTLEILESAFRDAELILDKGRLTIISTDICKLVPEDQKVSLYTRITELVAGTKHTVHILDSESNMIPPPSSMKVT